MYTRKKNNLEKLPHPRASIQLVTSQALVTRVPPLLCYQTPMNSNSLGILFFLTPTLSPDCPVQFSYWYKSPGLEARTHSGASSYWLAFQQLSETAATQTLTRRSSDVPVSLTIVFHCLAALLLPHWGQAPCLHLPGSAQLYLCSHLPAPTPTGFFTLCHHRDNFCPSWLCLFMPLSTIPTT